ncbi:hypothetical protein GT347_22980 [Xylophilus rhododendri]|uniref:Uncharacterized protein n=1 Tax=Xylophilus rhododendri TaxID=2697032 RepID=A0A857J974_9BURK|nr:hypothetical protein [Xylophilus rhododendri]QHJ00591.1 hypothetical protein GT347_22980 [Xylophilus rhododendri]
MDHLDILAHWLGWADMTAAVVLVLGAGLPRRPGRAPRGMVRLLFYGAGVVLCRYDLQPRLCHRLAEMGYIFYGRGPLRVALALPGKVRRLPLYGVPGKPGATGSMPRTPAAPAEPR